MLNREINFVDASLESQAATSHFCFVGATGSGKTICIRLLMQDSLYDATAKKITRALVYDAKGDTLPVLHGIVGPDDYEHGTQHNVITLNPFDARSYAWDMAADILTPGHAQQVATIFIPTEQNASQPFFANAARHILQGILIVFIRARQKDSKKHWTLRDVVFVLKSAKRICAVLESDEQTKHLVEMYFSHQETSKNVISELASRLSAFEIIAALWHKSKRSISLNDWATGHRDFILVLGSDHTNRATVDAINQLIFKRVSEILLDQPEYNTRRTWIILDEFARAGRLNGVVDLATKGRSKNVAMVFGFQDINGLRAVYEKEVAEEIIGQCSSIAILRLQSPETAEWASRLFGSYEKPELQESDGFTYGGESPQISEQTHYEIIKREAVLASEFMYLPPTGTKYGLHGYRYSPFVLRTKEVKNVDGRRGAKEELMKLPIAGDRLFGRLQPDNTRIGGILWEERKEPGVIHRNVADQYLEDWTKEDYERVGLSHLFIEFRNESKKQTKQRKEKLIRDLADLSFLEGFPNPQPLKRICKFTAQERTTFFRVLNDLKKHELFVGRFPNEEEAKEFNACSQEEKETLAKIIALLNDDRLPEDWSEQNYKRLHLDSLWDDNKAKQLIEKIADKSINGKLTPDDYLTIDNFSAKEKRSFLKECRKIEIEKYKVKAQEKRELIEQLIEVWIYRKLTEDEQEELKSLDESEQTLIKETVSSRKGSKMNFKMQSGQKVDLFRDIK